MAMSMIIRTRLRPPRLCSVLTFAARSPLSVHSTSSFQSSVKRPFLTSGRTVPLRLLPRYLPILPLSSHHSHWFVSTSTTQRTSTAASHQLTSTPQPQPSVSFNHAQPTTTPSPYPTPPTTTTPTATPTQPLATAISAELSNLPPPPQPTHTASLLARPFITAMHNYPLPLLLSLAVLEISSFSIMNQLLLAAGVQFGNTFAWAYLLSVPIRRSAVVKGLIGVPLGVVVGVMFPWFKEIRITELRRKSAQPRRNRTEQHSTAAQQSKQRFCSLSVVWMCDFCVCA